MKLRYIKNLNTEKIKELRNVEKNGKSFQTRQRAQAILLSHKGTKVNELCNIFNKSRITMYRWLNRFKNQELEELNDIDGRGRKPALDIEKDSKEVKEYMKVHNIRETCAILNQEKRYKKVSPQILKRFLKKMA